MPPLPKSRPVASDIDRAPLNSLSPSDPTTPETYRKLWDAFQEVSDQNFELKSKLAELERIYATSQILDTLIKPYATRTYWFMCAYCAFVGAMLVACLFGKCLDKDVLKVLVGSTAVTVIGLVGMVLTGIFVGARRRLGR